MGLGKDKGSSRINRYEHQVTAIGFDNLQRLADVLEVPVAYLVAETPAMADAILALANPAKEQRFGFSKT
jgi:transcriptional regulator with XRE-family HTH domain